MKCSFLKCSFLMMPFFSQIFFRCKNYWNNPAKPFWLKKILGVCSKIRHWICKSGSIGKTGTLTLTQKVIQVRITLIMMLNETDFYFQIQFFGIRIENKQNEILKQKKSFFRKCRIPKWNCQKWNWGWKWSYLLG